MSGFLIIVIIVILLILTHVIITAFFPNFGNKTNKLASDVRAKIPTKVDSVKAPTLDPVLTTFDEITGLKSKLKTSTINTETLN